jgi:hypothetical protein
VQPLVGASGGGLADVNGFAISVFHPDRFAFDTDRG